VNPGRPNLAFQTVPVVRDVLIAEPNGVGAAETSRFDDSRVGEVDLKNSGKLPFSDEAKDAAGLVGHIVEE